MGRPPHPGGGQRSRGRFGEFVERRNSRPNLAETPRSRSRAVRGSPCGLQSRPAGCSSAEHYPSPAAPGGASGSHPSSNECCARTRCGARWPWQCGDGAGAGRLPGFRQRQATNDCLFFRRERRRSARGCGNASHGANWTATHEPAFAGVRPALHGAFLRRLPPAV